MRPRIRLTITSFAICAASVFDVRAADDFDFFEKRIRPIFVEQCYECHSAKSRELGGNLRLDTREGVRRGGDTGPAIVPGKPGESLLIRAIDYGDESLQMPPRGKLKAEAIADLRQWIAAGAPDPRKEDEAAPIATAEPSWDETLRERRTWWSLQPVKRLAVPNVRAVGEHPIDRFLAASLQAKSLEFADAADSQTLIRRLSLVLTGLPPTPEQAAEFIADRSPQALERWVDRLLASPHFGERWARHWMDVVRFTETHGNEWNYEVHHAWRYRDYLIRAFNADVPYDQFVREHIAGDLLPQPRRNAAEQFNESVIGTAFYRFGEVNHDDCIGLRQIGYDLLDNQLDTLTKAFQATTVACARCHDHKIDAVSTRDYYALLGVLKSSRLVSHTIDDDTVNAEPIVQLQSLKTQLRPIIAEAWRRDGAEVEKHIRAAVARQLKHPDAEELAAGLDAERLEHWGKVLTVESSTPDDPLDALRSLVKKTSDDEQPISSLWKSLTERQAKLRREREKVAPSLVVWADFRRDDRKDWEIRGQGLRDGRTSSGEFVLHPDGDAIVANILPAGLFTHAVSDKLNGTLRSPMVPKQGKYVSFQVLGGRSSAVRLVSNNCQLNYKNYRALTSDEPTWVTFPIPDERDVLRNYVELMTMLDNPKFPDQLSALGGDKASYRVPFDEAAGDLRSYFGVTHIVVHDDEAPPKPTLDHLQRLFDGDVPETVDDVARRYQSAVQKSIAAWIAGDCTDDDVRWLAALVKHGLLTNTIDEMPQAKELVADYRRVEATIQSPRVVPGIGDFGPGADQAVFVRGDWQRPGDAVPRGYLEVLAADAFVSPAGSGRLELAERIASPANPLTARVMVNRIWQHLFGAGLVRTVDDFGHVGELPSHPELLDYLAARFVEEGWSTKRLIRLLVTSHAFRAAAAPSSAALQIDPENRLLSHYPARRMEAEAIRDAILAASGRLDDAMYGPSVQPFREQANADRRLFPGPLDGAGRRSVYIKFNLMEAPKFLGAFNLPGGKVAQGRRDATQVPAQALALLNDPFVLLQAGVWGERLCASRPTSLDDRIAAMFQTAYGRAPSTDERTQFAAVVRELGKLHGVKDADLLRSSAVWRDAAHALFVTEEFIYIP